MRLPVIIAFAALLGACSTPSFVGDSPAIPVVSQAPTHFELPARFAVARVVYNAAHTMGVEEAALWEDLANRADSFGSFAPLVASDNHRRFATKTNLIETARQQRYNYLLLVRMHPSTGSADIVLIHTGSGGVMATAQAISPTGGERGFWGGQIRNPGRLERTTLKIAEATVPVVEEMLRGAAERQR